MTDEPEVIDAEPESEQPESVPPPAPSQPRALAVRPATYEQQLEPTNQDGAWRAARIAFESGLFSGHRNRESVYMAIVAGRTYNLSMVQALTSIHIIKGKPSPSAGLLHALCLKHPKCLYFQLVELTEDHATYTSHRDGNPTPTTITYTMADADRAGLTGKDNWRTDPKAMMCARAVSKLAKIDYPDATHGLYIADELGADVAEDV